MKIGPASLCVALVLSGAGAVRAEPELLHDEASGLLELQGETDLHIDGLRGEIHVRAAASGKLRYEARTAADRDVPQPVALWLDGTTLRLTGLVPEEDTAVVMDVAIPRELDATVLVHDTTFSARSLEGDLKLTGERVRAELGYLHGSATVRLTGGELSATETQADLSIEGGGLSATLSYLRGPVSVDLRECTLDVQNLTRGVEGRLDRTVLRGEQVGSIDLDVSDGSVQMGQLLMGGRLRLSNTPLVLGPGKGDVEVETDGAVDFAGQNAAFRVVSFGGEVRGRDSSGELAIETHGGGVALEKVGGSVTVEGDGTRVRIQEAGGPVTVRVVSSDVVVDGAAESVRVENDFGDVTIRATEGQVHVVSRDGAVRATGLRGPIDLRADGLEVEVGWSDLGGGDSFVENAGGDVRASIPAAAQCRIVGKGSAGVRSEFDDVPVSADGDSANGALNQGRSPTIELRAGGMLYLGAGQ